MSVIAEPEAIYIAMRHLSPLGISPHWSERNVGAAGPPEAGPAKNVAADCVARLPVSVPDVVTGEPETLKIPGRESATLVTVPVPGGVAQVQSPRRKLVDEGVPVHPEKFAGTAPSAFARLICVGVPKAPE